ncbi:DUF2807 domain-containing protein [Myxococcota bacterium]|nr:DUF2807 domain-containing protein [Myxococcota bacterium]MBU1535629.1 DUF2807 domain-containing protein [Myxococcota bacterium]
MKLLLIAILLPISLLACNISGVKGSGVIIEEKRQVTPFTAVEISGGYTLTLSVGAKESLTLSGDDNLLPLIESSVEAGVLKLKNKKAISPKSPIVLKITTKSLSSLKIFGSLSGSVSGVSGGPFAASVSGSCSLTVTGKCDALKIRIAGSGNVNARGLSAKSAHTTISGSGKIAVAVTDSIHAKISGSGEISYAGNPSKVEKSISGSGKIFKQ